MSAPSANGSCNAGVQKQLSTTSRHPLARAMEAIAGTSPISVNGFEGVSKKNILVLLCTAADHASLSVKSTKLKSIPNFPSTFLNRFTVVPKILCDATT